MFEHKLFFFLHNSAGENNFKLQSDIAFTNICVK